MSNLLDLPFHVAHDSPVQKGRVAATVPELSVTVTANSGDFCVPCDILETAAGGLQLVVGDAVLVWAGMNAQRGIVLGRVAGPTRTDSSDPAPSARKRLVIEADADIIIRNKNAKILLTAEGDIEFVGLTFSARFQRLVRLLAPLIKLN